MAELTQHQLIAELSREIVMNVAPEELPIFRAQSEAYFKNPKKLLARKVGKDDMLGFGAGEAVAFLTPFILAVMSDVVTFLTDEIRKALKGEAASLITRTVKSLFKTRDPAADQDDKTEEKEEEKRMSLTAEQLDQVREIVLSRARQLKIAEVKADLLANSIVGSLL